MGNTVLTAPHTAQIAQIAQIQQKVNAFPDGRDVTTLEEARKQLVLTRNLLISMYKTYENVSKDNLQDNLSKLQEKAEDKDASFHDVLRLLAEYEAADGKYLDNTENEAAQTVLENEDLDCDDHDLCAVVRFLLRLLRHKNKVFKTTGRMILSRKWFTSNLSYCDAWEPLQEGTRRLLTDIGEPLRKLYEREQLQTRLGSFKPPMIAGHTQRQDYALPHPPGCDWKQQEQEEVYIHFLRLIAYAIDERYQRAVAECVKPFNCDTRPFKHPGIKSIKGFPRMFHKMISSADHRYSQKPRPANMDINRCLVPTEDWEGMLGIMHALLKRFGPFAKFKNQMSLTEAAASNLYHLRLMLVSVQYDTGMTFADLCKDEHAQQRWSEYRAQPPPSTVPGGRWCQRVEAAFRWLHAPELADKKVTLMCEVQCMLREYRDVRLKMHEVYKVHRADNDTGLFNDFKQIRLDKETKQTWTEDGSTPEFRCCRDNQIAELQLLIEANGGKLDDLNQCAIVAVRNGSVDVSQELLAMHEVDLDNHNQFVEAVSNPNNFKTMSRMVELLMNAKVHADELLQSMVFDGHRDVVHTLLQAKADANSTQNDELEWPVILLAAQNGHLDVVRELVAAKADPNGSSTDGDTALYWAATNGHRDVVHGLLDLKADVNSVEENGITSLMRAAEHGFLDIIRDLVLAKADVDAVSSNNNFKALDYAEYCGMDQAAELLRTMIEA